MAPEQSSGRAEPWFSLLDMPTSQHPLHGPTQTFDQCLVGRQMGECEGDLICAGMSSLIV